ncbi:MAG: class I adenylate-forming enzyme family protein, partial [Candidatus Sericytochromatia bacterium]
TVYGRLTGLASRFAVHQGRVVAFAMADGPVLAERLVACMMSGAIAFPLPAGATAPEREAALAGLDVALLLESALGEDAPDALWLPPSADDVALLVGTSGSTGRPKRVALRYGGLAWNALAHAEALELPDGVKTLIASPLYHAFPLVAQLLATWLKGGAVGFLGSAFTPRGLLKRIEADGIGYVALTPTSLRLLRERCPEATLPPILSVGAAPMPAGELMAAAAWAGANGAAFYHTYGLSEAGPRVATLGPDDLDRHPASVGRLLPGVEVRLVDPETGLDAEDEGELWLRSPSLMAGYHPALDGLEPDGWLRTGDRARLADGILTLTGRLKDIIVSGGTTVSLREIEEALLLEPRVLEAAVVGVPHPIYGEVPRACLVAQGPITRQETIHHLAGLLSRHKLPQEVVFLSDLPRTALGKVDKAKLKELPCEASP